MQKLSRGQKLCKHCQAINASRQRVCKSCNREFLSKNTPVKGEILNWRELTEGDLVKIVNGSGPYFICKKDSEECRAGERIAMHETGIYKVIKKKCNGLVVFGVSKNNKSFSFLYMDKPYVTKDNINMSPYRIKKVKRRW